MRRSRAQAWEERVRAEATSAEVVPRCRPRSPSRCTARSPRRSRAAPISSSAAYSPPTIRAKTIVFYYRPPSSTVYNAVVMDPTEQGWSRRGDHRQQAQQQGAAVLRRGARRQRLGGRHQRQGQLANAVSIGQATFSKWSEAAGRAHGAAAILPRPCCALARTWGIDRGRRLEHLPGRARIAASSNSRPNRDRPAGARRSGEALEELVKQPAGARDVAGLTGRHRAPVEGVLFDVAPAGQALDARRTRRQRRARPLVAAPPRHD